jgi:transposase
MSSIIGIDISKKDFYACLEEAGEPIIFANNKSGIKRFTGYLKKEKHTKNDTIIGLESTGIYHLPLSYVLSKSGFTVKVINPLITKRANQGTVRKVKNDRKDSELIRHCAANGAGNQFIDTAETLKLKGLVRQRDGLADMKNTLNIKQQNVDYKTKNLNIELPLVYQELSNEISLRIKTLEKELAKARPKEQKLLQTIPGVGPITAVSFISEIIDISRFPNSQKLAAYIGLDSRVYQSGTSIHGKGYISKRGNKILRTRLYNAASVAVLHDNMFKTFFQKKRAEGKPYKVALVATMHKMVHVIYAVWKRGTPFEDRRAEIENQGI